MGKQVKREIIVKGMHRYYSYFGHRIAAQPTHATVETVKIASGPAEGDDLRGCAHACWRAYGAESNSGAAYPSIRMTRAQLRDPQFIDENYPYLTVAMAIASTVRECCFAPYYCTNCHLPPTQHVGGKCLFSAHTYEAGNSAMDQHNPGWRTRGYIFADTD